MTFTPSNTTPLRVGQRVRISASHPDAAVRGQLADVEAVPFGGTVAVTVLPANAPAFAAGIQRADLWTVRGKPFAAGHDSRQRQSLEGEAKAKASTVVAGHPCPACKSGRITVKYQRRTGKPFGGCSRYPSCTFAAPLAGDHAAKIPAPIQSSNFGTAGAKDETVQTPLANATALADAVAAIAALTQRPADALDRDAVAAIIDDVVTPQLAALEARIAEAGGGTRSLTFTVNGGEAKTVAGAHAALADIVEAATVLSPRNVYVAGPAGSGKTTLAAHVAEALGLSFALTALSGGATEGDLLGRTVPNLTTGERTYTPSPFVLAYRDGGVILLDEIDGADANVLLALNAALANGHMTLPTGERIARHADCVVIAAANTFGNGAGQLYVGRAQLDAAFLDRFAGATFFVDYDRTVEAALAGCTVAKPTAWLKRIWTVRERVSERRIRRVVSTRAVIAAARWVAAGKSQDAALSRLVAAWSREDLVAVGEAELFHGEGR